MSAKIQKNPTTHLNIGHFCADNAMAGLSIPSNASSSPEIPTITGYGVSSLEGRETQASHLPRCLERDAHRATQGACPLAFRRQWIGDAVDTHFFINIVPFCDYCGAGFRRTGHHVACAKGGRPERRSYRHTGSQQLAIVMHVGIIHHINHSGGDTELTGCHRPFHNKLFFHLHIF